MEEQKHPTKKNGLEKWKQMSTKEKIIRGVCALALLILIVFLLVKYLPVIQNGDEYKAYKYAKECVEDELKYPDTATFPSFRDVTIEKSRYTTAIILDSHSVGGGRSIDCAWDISGSGTCENALGMKINYSFTVTVVLSESGDLWCYKCSVD